MSSDIERGRAAAALALTLLVGGALLGLGPAAAGAVRPARSLQPGAHPARSLRPEARPARSLRATDTAHLHYISASGSMLIETGRATGTLPGDMHVRFSVGATLSGSFTIYASGGTLVGHGAATPHGAGVYESFAGTLIVTGGSGRYLHAHGRAGLYGTFDRDNYALVVQTTGTLSY